MPSVLDNHCRRNRKNRPHLPGRSLMSQWTTLSYYCKLLILAFCLRPLPHFQPSPPSDSTW